MSSVFKKTEEELKKQEIENIDFDSLLEKGLKIYRLDEKLELLLYDVSDALKDQQALLVEAQEGREVAYLIPIFLAYQNTTYFKRFVIATNSSKVRKNILSKIKELSKLLQVDMPVHILENESKYFCLKKLAGYNKKRKKPLKNFHQNAMGRNEWRKIQVRNCTLKSCPYFKRCKYAIDYEGISKEGISIISHATLIGNRRHSQTRNVHEDSDIIIIDEADAFARNIKDAYQQLMSFDYIHNCFSRAKQLLNRPEYSYITNENFRELKNFFEELSHCEKGENWKVSPQLQASSEKLFGVCKNIIIHLTRQGAIKNFSPEIEQFCDMIYIIEKFFEDIASSGDFFKCQLQEKERSEDTPDFRRVQVFYYPNKVDGIISNRLKNENGSIVFTGSRIAEEDGRYQQLISDCGIEDFRKEVVKEYVLK